MAGLYGKLLVSAYIIFVVVLLCFVIMSSWYGRRAHKTLPPEN
ncbi:MAG: hypothetical protein U0586_01985 [Candidatus Brocadiaceae bacterium]